MTEIREIMVHYEPQRYPLRDLLKALICSQVFLER
jgi:hypothetical protein